MEISGVMLKGLERVTARDTQSPTTCGLRVEKRGMNECRNHHRRLDIYAQRKGTQSGIVVRTEPAREYGLQVCRKSWEMAGTIKFQITGWGCSARGRQERGLCSPCAIRGVELRRLEVRELGSAGVIETSLVSPG